MKSQPKAAATESQLKDKLLPKLTIAFFDRPLRTLILWLVLIIFGALSYTTLLKREGFPSIEVPVAVISGSYLANDPSAVDSKVTKPITDAALQNPAVSTVQSTSADNFFTVVLQYKDGTDAQAATADLRKRVSDQKLIPQDANAQYNVPYFGATGGDIQQVDLAVAFYQKADNTNTQDLVEKATAASKYLNDQHIKSVKSVAIKNPYKEVVNPATGQKVQLQQNFDRFGVRENGKTSFYNAVTITIAADKNKDVITLDQNVRKALDELKQQKQFEGYDATVSASFAPAITENINELQSVLLEGLIAVLVVGSIVIAIRASLITILSMITVLLTTISLLYLVGYTLNVITLFGLILGLSLIVDDTIIMVEAIDAARRNSKDRRQIVREATRKISRAMVAATTTAALSFAPLLFVGGILGTFIRAIPITIISALIISLLVALIIIPLLARFLLLGDKQLKGKGITEIAAGFEEKIAHGISWPMRHAQGSRKRLLTLTVAAVIFGTLFIGSGIVIARGVVFNIFPQSKDADQLMVQLQFAPHTSLEQAQAIAQQAENIASDSLGDTFKKAAYYSSGDAQSAMIQIDLLPYGKREPKSPELVKQLQANYNNQLKQATANVSQIDAGPPAASFVVQINADNRDAALKLSKDVASYLANTTLTRPDNSTAHFTNPIPSSPERILRSNGNAVVTVTAGFDATDTTTLVNLARDSITKHYDAARLASFGLQSNAITFDIGQESQNQDSFKTLALAFPAVLLVIYLLLVLEFRSFLQPLLIFMAIPFSIFGVMLGLRITNNAISFFSMLGFFALIGLSIKNTILLTDYANQSRKMGLGAVDAAAAAIHERFRPLFATSVTAVVSLIPLAITSPFWQGLAVVLIFGLVSSTFLVLTVFPYYYLIGEYLRDKLKSRTWLKRKNHITQ